MWLAHVVDGTHFRHECSWLDRWHVEKIWKNTTHFRHECEKRSEIQDVSVQKSVQIFKKWSKSSYTCLWTKETIFRNEQAGKWIDATKKDTPPRRKHSFLTWTIWEPTSPPWTCFGWSDGRRIFQCYPRICSLMLHILVKSHILCCMANLGYAKKLVGIDR